jgi:hypothetical protein
MRLAHTLFLAYIVMRTYRAVETSMRRQGRNGTEIVRQTDERLPG